MSTRLDRTAPFSVEWGQDVRDLDASLGFYEGVVGWERFGEGRDAHATSVVDT
jgi:predicted enzyme related to lactoylglutathione lyase